jgi:DNA-binding response OmpR family regulator
MDYSSLDGQSILVVEAQPAVARELRAALEEAGAEVVVAHDAKEALADIAQYEFSAAVLDWQPDCSDHRTGARWFEEEGIRFLFCVTEPPADVNSARGAPIFVKPTLPGEIVKALAHLIKLNRHIDTSA